MGTARYTGESSRSPGNRPLIGCTCANKWRPVHNSNYYYSISGPIPVDLWTEWIRARERRGDRILWTQRVNQLPPRLPSILFLLSATYVGGLIRAPEMREESDQARGPAYDTSTRGVFLRRWQAYFYSTLYVFLSSEHVRIYNKQRNEPIEMFIKENLTVINTCINSNLTYPL